MIYFPNIIYLHNYNIPIQIQYTYPNTVYVHKCSTNTIHPTTLSTYKKTIQIHYIHINTIYLHKYNTNTIYPHKHKMSIQVQYKYNILT
jgi:hypothetical protein